MFNKLFSDSLPKVCRHCEYYVNQNGAGLCSRKNEPVPGEVCRLYVYDPLKRIPVLPPEMPVFKPEDFKI